MHYEVGTMLEKYRATIQGDRITWDEDVPSAILDRESVDVIVTLNDQPISQSKADSRRAVEALQAIADRGGIKSIPDPVKWQREIRKKHPLDEEEVMAADQKLEEPNGRKLVAILQKIADRGGIPSIKDPVKWQREIRKDRPLPGRE